MFCCFDVLRVRLTQIFQVKTKTSAKRPLFLDYHFVTYDYGLS